LPARDSARALAVRLPDDEDARPQRRGSRGVYQVYRAQREQWIHNARLKVMTQCADANCRSQGSGPVSGRGVIFPHTEALKGADGGASTKS